MTMVHSYLMMVFCALSDNYEKEASLEPIHQARLFKLLVIR